MDDIGYTYKFHVVLQSDRVRDALTENKKPILTYADIEAIAVQYWTIVSELTLRPRAAIRLCFTRDVATNITATSKKMRFVSTVLLSNMQRLSQPPFDLPEALDAVVVDPEIASVNAVRSFF